MTSKRYGAEFKAEAVKQVTELRYKIAEVAERLGVSVHSLYAWLREGGVSRAGEPAARSKTWASYRSDAEAHVRRPWHPNQKWYMR